MLQVDHVTHLGGIFLSDWLTMKYNRVGKTAGSENLDLDFLGLNLILPGCSFWLLEIEEDRPINVFSTSKVLFPLLTV